MPSPFETRTVSATFEVRADADNPTLEGYAATFNQPYDMGAFRESIDAAAFNRTLSMNPDVRLLIDHEGQPLARTKSGTLRLAPDSTGLHVRASLEPSDPDVQRLLPKMHRGDLDQMSFAFKVPNGGDEWSSDYTLRTLREVSLAGGDVSVVTYPANENTSVSVRARDQRSACVALGEAIWTELRAGKVVSADNMARLKKVLDALAAADDNLDAAEAAVAEIIGVADPDNDDADKQAVTQMNAANKQPYGDVDYADPGYQEDGKKRYPIDTADHVRAAWSYINQAGNTDPYTAEQIQQIKNRIKAAAKKFGIEISEANGRPLSLALAVATRLSV